MKLKITTPETMCMEKCEELLEDHNARVLEVVRQKYNSKGVDVTAFDPNEFVLAKILMTSALEECARCFTPHATEHVRMVRNLANF